jgi:DeoR family ulaG and ulaABCDEF operon transcriptional repressor
MRISEKQAIAQKAAVELCEDGDPIIINGGTTTFQMVHPLATKRCQVFTNSFPIAEHLLKHSKNTDHAVGRRDLPRTEHHPQPFDNDVTRNFYAKRMFMGAQGSARSG